MRNQDEKVERRTSRGRTGKNEKKVNKEKEKMMHKTNRRKDKNNGEKAVCLPVRNQFER